jgi:Fe-S-cluster containining protein
MLNMQCVAPNKHFICVKCGLCCQNLHLFNNIYNDLDDGYGVCKFFDKFHNLCTIYEHRPLKCNVEKSYYMFNHLFSYNQYLELMREGCLLLQQNKVKG